MIQLVTDLTFCKYEVHKPGCAHIKSSLRKGMEDEGQFENLREASYFLFDDQIQETANEMGMTDDEAADYSADIMIKVHNCAKSLK